MRVSLVAVGGSSSSSCGYCSAPGERASQKTSKSFYLFTYALDPEAYQALIDAGWRRSGEVLYKPDNSRTCCPQHPIRLPIERFNISRSQRRALKSLFWEVHAPEDGTRPMKKRGDDNDPFDLESFWLNTEWTSQDEHRKAGGTTDNTEGNSWYRFPKRRRLEITLHPASHTEEKFQLYKRYQTTVHKDEEAKITHDSWKRFLVRNSFTDLPLLSHPVDGELIAVGVLDILPLCVSSVYLFYEPGYEHLNLGKASALREIHLASQLRRKRGMEGVRYYYLGYWIASCQKMVYKAEFRPQSVFDTATNQWQPLSEVRPAIDAGVRFDFSSPQPTRHAPRSATDREEGTKPIANDDDEEEDEEPFSHQIPTPLPPGWEDPNTISTSDTLVLIQSRFSDSRIKPLGTTSLAADTETVTKLRAARSALAGLSRLFAFIP
ncbi:unnamed protein product [Tilletia caries]|nr:unnamed protein product [Tilletia caries]